LRFLTAEFALRPAVRRVSGGLASGAPLAGAGVPLRLRLLITLLAMNVMTALIVGTAASGGGSAASGTGIVVAVGAGLLCSLGVSLLLARSVVEPMLGLRDAADRVTSGVLDAQAPVLAGDETGELAVSLNRMLLGLRERAGLRHYVPGEVADRLAAEGGRLPAEEVDVTVVFLDVRGFTALSERVSGVELAGRLNRLFERVVPIIERHGGHANKFVGDGLLAVFGSPRPLEHHADAAVEAVLEIIEGAPGDELPLCAGVNSGRAVVATIGGGARLDFTVLGDVVNTAARVQSATRETGDPVLITEAVVERLARGATGWSPRPPMVLRGKALPARLFGYAAWRSRTACDRYSQVGMFMGPDPAPREDTWT
ncbi:MAG: adenylate/guanylate cyclase domain-containing protein, partial [Baekduiaceae bacterium]